eukprot:TRINITY_DN9427_c0_g1_i1.p1 TRINITY_DN9427_c0_g1~~TRINITY_DN9427_c0_g1_i1.p1  ORF type:complete len:715 (+),score=256.70 TRINITY_DN9427_c0_g1_i1:73-2217(+)
MSHRQRSGTLRKLFGLGPKDSTVKPVKPKSTKSKPKREKKSKKDKKKNNANRQQAQKVRRGRLYLNAQLNGNQLELEVEEGKDLMGVDKNDESNPYLVVTCTAPVSDQQQTTEPIPQNRRPKFKSKFSWTLPSSLNKDQARVRIQVRHHGKGRHKQAFMGGMAFAIAEIEDEDTPTEGWFRLLDEKKAENQNVPFRVKRKNEMTAEQMEIYGVITDFKPSASVPTASASEPNEDSDMYLQPVKGGGVDDDGDLPELPVAPKKSTIKVDASHYDYHKVLGRGAFGKVLLAEEKATKTMVAVKVLSKDAVIDDDDVESTISERQILAKAADCPFLTKLHATFQTDAHLYFVMEFVTGGDLMFHAQELGKFTEPQAQFLLGEICLGLWFLHERGVIYRDIKLDNIMLEGSGHVKIADFGLSKQDIWGASTTETMCGTPTYMSPEIINEEPYSFSVDWWALGVLAYELMVGDPPFAGDDVDEIFEDILKKVVEFPPHMSSEAQALVSAWLHRPVDGRLGCGDNGKDDIKKHQFFTSMDWGALERREIEPPYKPKTGSDPTANFDEEFTEMDVENTPVDPADIANIDQQLFIEFDYVAGASDADLTEEAPLAAYKWYRPELNRKTANAVLQSSNPGTFIVRESKSQPGCYAISVWLGDKMWHGVISPSTTATGQVLYKLYVKSKFPSIPDLVDNYHGHPIALNKRGQPIVLLGDGEDDE